MNQSSDWKGTIKMTPNELMKEKKAIALELSTLFEEDVQNSTILLNASLEEAEKIDYDFAVSTRRVEELQGREREIKQALNLFNATTKIKGFEMTISEGLVYIGQINTELDTLNRMASKRNIYPAQGYNGVSMYYKLAYDTNEVKARIKNLEQLKNDLQAAIDTTNITEEISL